ncbi:MAG TPA: hypothetical protein VFZ16_05210 [Hyphomicrobiaceae bacterium]|nr:hypothetical protein [Hyphomicrobiaceae bacterium]
MRRGGVWRLPGEPGSDEFHAEYQRLLAETAPKAPERAAKAFLRPRVPRMPAARSGRW